MILDRVVNESASVVVELFVEPLRNVGLRAERRARSRGADNGKVNARLAEGAAQAAAQLVGVNLAAVPGDARTVLASDIAARASTARERAGAST